MPFSKKQPRTLPRSPSRRGARSTHARSESTARPFRCPSGSTIFSADPFSTSRSIVCSATIFFSRAFSLKPLVGGRHLSYINFKSVDKSGTNLTTQAEISILLRLCFGLNWSSRGSPGISPFFAAAEEVSSSFCGGTAIACACLPTVWGEGGCRDAASPPDSAGTRSPSNSRPIKRAIRAEEGLRGHPSRKESISYFSLRHFIDSVLAVFKEKRSILEFACSGLALVSGGY